MFLSGSLFTTSLLMAQGDKKTVVADSSYFKLSVGYLSNYVYTGRKDSLITPYISPSLGYYDKSGFYISGTLSYLSSGPYKSIDLFSLDIGYDFTATDKFSGSVYANKSFYKQTSTTITSDIKGSLGGSVSYDLDFLLASGGVDMILGTKTDFGLNVGLSHAFSFGSNDDLFTIAPSVYSYLSTLHFYEGYTNRKTGKANKQFNPNLASSVSTTTVDSDTGLTLLDYEVSLPLTYDRKKVGFYLTPTIAIPKNPIYTTTTTVNKLPGGATNTIVSNSTPQSEKNLSTVFFVELGLYIKL